MEIAGLPLHPLVVHATVVLVPLSATLTIALAVLPRWRWLSRWPAAGFALVATALAWLASQSGEALVEARPDLERLVDEHQELGELLALATLPYLVVVLAAAWALSGPTALASGRGARESHVPALEKLLPPLLVVGSLGVVVLVVLAGDSGARAVWG